MELKVITKILFSENESDFRRSGNENSFDIYYQADSDEIIPIEDTATLDFKINNVNKYVYELKNGNSFDVLILQDILRAASTDNIASLHIFCYESTSIKPFKIPIRFDVTLDDANLVLGNMSELTLGNLKGLSSDIRINNIQIPFESKGTLVIIAATKD